MIEIIDFLKNIISSQYFYPWAIITIVSFTLITFAIEIIPIELSALTSLAILILFFNVFPYKDGDNVFNPNDFFLGFSNISLIAVVSLTIVGQGLIYTGILDSISETIISLTKSYPNIGIWSTLLVAFFISGFMNNIPVVVIFIPLITTIAKSINVPSSQIFIPLAFISTLGGMTTLIGSGTNILVHSTLQNMGLEGFTFFEFTIPGMMLAITGIIYLKISSSFILPQRLEQQDSSNQLNFTVHIKIWKTSNLIGKRTKELNNKNNNIKFTLIKTDSKNQEYIKNNIPLQEGDLIQIKGTSSELFKIFSEASFITNINNFNSLIGYNHKYKGAAPTTIEIVEAVIPPNSSLIKSRLQEARQYLPQGCRLLGIHHSPREEQYYTNEQGITDIENTRIKSGDSIILLGYWDDLFNLNHNKDIILIERTIHTIPATPFALRAILIFISMIIASSTGIVNIAQSSFLAAVAMVALRCLPIQRALKTIDFKIITLVCISIAIATAMDITGTSNWLVKNILEYTHLTSPLLTISIFFLTLVVFTNILSNFSCAIIFTPIAVELSSNLGTDPKIFAIAVIFASSTSFASPIAHPTNLLVISAGNYKFKDYFKTGFPLTIIIWLSFTVIAHLYYKVPL